MTTSSQVLTIPRPRAGSAVPATDRSDWAMRSAGSAVLPSLPATGTAAVTRLAERSTLALLGNVQDRPGIAGTAYDTAWLASVPAERRKNSAYFPSALQWLVDHQHADGSWGGSLRYEHDRLLCTLAALPPLATFGRRSVDQACVQRGTRYLWQHGHLLKNEAMELVGFELLLPALVKRAQQAGIPVPPYLNAYNQERVEKLRLLPPAALYSARTTVAHSLEFLGDEADLPGLRSTQAANGAIGNSPAATAFYYTLSGDPRALAYLEECIARSGGVMAPVLYPCETFETLWAAYHLHLAGIPSQLLLSHAERAAMRTALATGGVGLSSTFPIPDADDTAVALLLLHDLGEPTDIQVLENFARPDGHYVTFPFERHSSVGVNVHVLHALSRLPGHAQRHAAIAGLLAYLADEQCDGMYWLDKWHISPYYATAHALCVLSQLPAEHQLAARPLITQAAEWLRQTQNRDGSWGFYGQATAEETAYAVLGLASLHTEPDRRRCLAGSRYLDAVMAAPAASEEACFPPMWIDKCLYRPTLVVRAAIVAAQALTKRLRVQQGGM
ncbi:MAG TPA: prenyltransferase/squalene oxidase repeat-containing protein [Chloroflexota bacterium]